MKKMSIYEPAMCCSTGLCGVSVDPELLRISTVINTLKKNGIEVKRFNLSNSPQEFMDNELVNIFINAKGVKGLPITVLGDEIAVAGRYPTNEEFIKFLDLPANLLSEQAKPARYKMTGRSGGCGCSGGGCC